MAAQTRVIMPSLHGFVGKPPKLPMDTLQRAVSDLSLELKKENLTSAKHLPLPPLSEVEKATCECCGMSEDFTQEYNKKCEREVLREMGVWPMFCGH